MYADANVCAVPLTSSIEIWMYGYRIDGRTKVSYRYETVGFTTPGNALGGDQSLGIPLLLNLPNCSGSVDLTVASPLSYIVAADESVSERTTDRTSFDPAKIGLPGNL
jgi:hypothetical protein